MEHEIQIGCTYEIAGERLTVLDIAYKIALVRFMDDENRIGVISTAALDKPVLNGDAPQFAIN
jgi:hypothetical protein